MINLRTVIYGELAQRLESMESSLVTAYNKGGSMFQFLAWPLSYSEPRPLQIQDNRTLDFDPGLSST